MVLNGRIDALFHFEACPLPGHKVQAMVLATNLNILTPVTPSMMIIRLYRYLELCSTSNRTPGSAPVFAELFKIFINGIL